MNRFKAWRDGDVVQLRALGHVIVGRAVVCGRMVKVSYTDLAGRDRLEWPSASWHLGTGAHEKRCVHCETAFATNDPSEIFCPGCNMDAVGKTAGDRGPKREFVRMWGVKR